MSEKENGRIPSPYAFHRTSLSMCLNQVLVQTKSMACGGLPAHHFLITEVTRLLVLALGLSELPFPLMAGPSEVCAQGNITNPIHQWLENQWVETPLVSVSLLLHILH